MVEFEEIGDIWIDPELRGGEETAVLGELVVAAAKLFFDAFDLVFLDMCVVDSEGHFAGF